MKNVFLLVGVAVCTAVVLRGPEAGALRAESVVPEAVQGADTSAAHRAVARNLGAAEWPELLNNVCREPATGADAAARGTGASGGATGPNAARGRGQTVRQTPPREQWHREPVKVFDNLYFVGQTEY